MLIGRVIEGRGGFYTVIDESTKEKIVLRPQKKLKKQDGGLLIGDRVAYSEKKGDDDGWVLEILKRKNSFVRPPVANVDCLVIVVAALPKPDFLLVDKLLISCVRMNIIPIIAVNKLDLGNEIYETAYEDYKDAAEKVIKLSSYTKEGIEELKKAMRGRICCLSGQSGVGKSSLISALCDRDDIEIGELSQKIDRGKQTTRHATLFIKDELYIFDTPGFTLLEMPKDMEPTSLQDYYPDFEKYKHECRFSPCMHYKEPDCGVEKAEKDGLISKNRLNRYRELLLEVKNTWRDRYEK